MLGCDRDCRNWASRKIISMHLEVDFDDFITLMATKSPVILLLAKDTHPNPPYPIGLRISNSPKLRLESNSSPRLTYSRFPSFTYSKSSSNSSTASTPNILRFRGLKVGHYASIFFRMLDVLMGLVVRISRRD